jgi:hypothetical protein
VWETKFHIYTKTKVRNPTKRWEENMRA